MFTVTVILGAAFVGLVLLMLVRLFGNRPARSSEVVDHISAYGFQGAAAIDLDAGRHRGSDVISRLGDYLHRRRLGASDSEIRSKLIAAGIYDRSPRQIIGFQLLGAVALLAFWLLVGGLGDLPTGVYIVGIPLFALLGWFAPSIVLDRMVKKRLNEIERALPELIDLLVVSVEAGLSLIASIRLVSSQLDGPLAQELRLTQQEQNMGLSTSEALQGLAKRIDTPGIRTFVRSVSQSETLGVSIGQVLRNLADEMRKRRRAFAEEKAQKAPVKMLFPLVLLIFPALFVVLLVPALITVWRTLS